MSDISTEEVTVKPAFKLTPLLKGAITGAAMAGVSLLYYYLASSNTGLQFVIYFLYAAGIMWAIVPYVKSAAYTRKFLDIFTQGFRCFIIVVLVMATFTYTFAKSHPEMAEEAALAYKEELVKKNDKTPQEIEEEIGRAKNGYVTTVVNITIFGYLITGAIFTAIGSGILLLRTK